MSGNKIIGIIIGLWIVLSFATAKVLQKKAQKTVYTADILTPIDHRTMGLYEKYVKRGLDIFCAATAMTVLSPLYLAISVLVLIKLGRPVIFVQERPGLIDESGKETVFKMYKFRTMTDERYENGKLFPDEMRTGEFGRKLRASSLDELPEVINILNGTMSVIGPRPQLIKDLVFMSEQHRQRHTAKPGLSGLAQIMGRDAISWDEKFEWDLEYIKNVNLKEDIRIIWATFKQVFLRNSAELGLEPEADFTLDYGDTLVKEGKIILEDYNCLLEKAESIINQSK